MKPKYAILIMDKLKLVKFSTTEEMNNLILDLEQAKRPYQVLKKHDEIWSVIEAYV